MGFLLIGFSLYLSFHTIKYARLVWKDENNKFAGAVIVLMAMCFPVLSIMFYLK
ncbi:hypothetical protein KHA96_22665 [Bacillus sp. FJAT-49711]|uniref:hypothetical protein n=1 Tax=Bacillus sp. FJAT-49711 TaxID=2833585 RepID=UPI001BC8F94B|nr:hypothetical protein [Bacillus sp. FJAT-49711]MBS4221099.1 hypothetical protein [Bacillus sp. FJAT-49711]